MTPLDRIRILCESIRASRAAFAQVPLADDPAFQSAAEMARQCGIATGALLILAREFAGPFGERAIREAMEEPIAQPVEAQQGPRTLQ